MMNRYKLIIFLLLFVTVVRAQSDLRKAGIYEVGDTTIEVYNWKEPFAIREFKIINGTDIILFREFNALTKKIKQEGSFKGGYSTGTWKFYGWTGRLKKETNYDYMVKTFYEKKKELNALDFDYEKYKEDSLFVYNYWKQKKGSNTGTNSKLVNGKRTELPNDSADSSPHITNSLLMDQSSKKGASVKTSGEKKGEGSKNTTDSLQIKQIALAKDESKGLRWRRGKKDVEKTIDTKTADSLKNSKNAMVVKEPIQPKETKPDAVVKPVATEKTESPKKVVDAAKEKQPAVIAKEPVQPKENKPGAVVKPVATEKTEPSKKVVDAAKEKQPAVIAKESVKSPKETKPDAVAKPVTTEKTEPSKKVVDATKEKQPAVIAKESVKSTKENKADAVIKSPDNKKAEAPKEIIDATKKQHTAVVKEPVKSNKEINTAVNGETGLKNKQNTTTQKTTTNAGNTAKTADIKEVNATNSKANELLLEEYTRLKKEKMPNVNENTVTKSKSEQKIDSVKNKQNTSSEQVPVKSEKQPSTNNNSKANDSKQMELKEKSSSKNKQDPDSDKAYAKTKKEAEAVTNGRASNMKKSEQNKTVLDSLKQGGDSTLTNKAIKTGKVIDSTTRKTGEVKKPTSIK